MSWLRLRFQGRTRGAGAGLADAARAATLGVRIKLGGRVAPGKLVASVRAEPAQRRVLRAVPRAARRDDEADSNAAAATRSALAATDELIKSQESAFFREPVDTLYVPDYLDVVARPMDLSTLRADITSRRSRPSPSSPTHLTSSWRTRRATIRRATPCTRRPRSSRGAPRSPSTRREGASWPSPISPDVVRRGSAARAAGRPGRCPRAGPPLARRRAPTSA